MLLLAVGRRWRWGGVRSRERPGWQRRDPRVRQARRRRLDAARRPVTANLRIIDPRRAGADVQHRPGCRRPPGRGYPRLEYRRPPGRPGNARPARTPGTPDARRPGTPGKSVTIAGGNTLTISGGQVITVGGGARAHDPIAAGQRTRARGGPRSASPATRQLDFDVRGGEPRLPRAARTAEGAAPARSAFTTSASPRRSTRPRRS